MEDFSKKNKQNEDNEGVFDNIYATMFKILVTHGNKYAQDI